MLSFVQSRFLSSDLRRSSIAGSLLLLFISAQQKLIIWRYYIWWRVVNAWTTGINAWYILLHAYGVQSSKTECRLYNSFWGESDYSKRLGMTLDRISGGSRFRNRRKVIPFVAMFMSLIFITCNCRYDLVSEADSVTIHLFVFRKSVLYECKKHASKICYICKRAAKLD